MDFVFVGGIVLLVLLGPWVLVWRISSRRKPTTPGFARRTRPAHSEDPGTDASAGTGGGEATGNAAADDASRRGSADGLSLRVSDWNTRTLSLRETDCQLCGVGSVGRVQW